MFTDEKGQTWETIGDMRPGQTFRLDYRGTHEGLPCTYAGKSYIYLGSGLVREAGEFGRSWTLAECGLNKDTVIYGPVWSAPK